MKFEETKTELKARWSKAIDALHESGGKEWQKVFNNAVSKEFEDYPTEQLMLIVEHWPEDTNQEVIADGWRTLEPTN